MKAGAPFGIDPAWIGLAVAALALAGRSAVLWRVGRERRRLAERVLLERLLPLPPARHGWLRAVMFAGGVGILASAAAGATTARPETGPESGPETVVVLDASNSMLAEDVEPSRLYRQRALARDLVLRLAGQVAVVYFAGRGYVLSPLTTDVDAALMFIDAVRPASVGRGGSALPAGLTKALDVLAGGGRDVRRSIVLFSDGEETAGESLEEALQRSAEAGIPVHTVGIGTTEGGPIPLGRDAAVSGTPTLRFPETSGRAHLRGPDGEVVVTRLDGAVLRGIAEQSGGAYVPGSTSGMGALARRILASEASAGRLRPGEGGVLLLLMGFGLLWTEAFLLRRG